ncbi:MAG: hypothetical protein EOS25_00705 [Mesorhizobium sp.]|uniref:hypothetical protein n=1 Tax=Mesorhizobium sp. TaxID=1871066 RepID=UPI000FEAADD5|nr:hypothetical protein [Mesorhizobium sp.]RWD47238.1 MAG: hypothetical protein EOS59_19095 [Mesorhizobium sp.]RWE61638.1 MAG: hypothetical protein EOS24_11935 [Mesorhizobium sp.]RWF13386.1 MAG: hypothetical protein EOS69_01480 [Mesorhizobium sp.]RWF22831.1 MAG: hypothetical protein EOS25_00705 [Mesorhizobium sp.]TIY06673.1 MAG: hypothetical protein E5V22_02170 [Mesorhizobium sp.]
MDIFATKTRLVPEYNLGFLQSVNVSVKMPITEHTPERLVLKSGSTTLSLSKEIGKARMQSKLLFWKLKPAEAPLSDIVDVTVDTNVDRASGVDICSTMLVMRTGAGWAFPGSDKEDAQLNADAIREFVGLPASAG